MDTFDLIYQPYPIKSIDTSDIPRYDTEPYSLGIKQEGETCA